MRSGAFAFAALVAISLAGHAGGSGDEVARREVASLVEAVGASGCRFQRNGRWHSPDAAQAHIQRKLDAARRRGLEGDAEDFIARVASRSSVTGRPYRVRCDGVPEQSAAAWFGMQLQLLREADSSRLPR